MSSAVQSAPDDKTLNDMLFERGSQRTVWIEVKDLKQLMGLCHLSNPQLIRRIWQHISCNDHSIAWVYAAKCGFEVSFHGLDTSAGIITRMKSDPAAVISVKWEQVKQLVSVE